jgi:hypothetical protein
MKHGLYLYGFVRTDEDLDFGDIGLDHDGKPARVHTLRSGPIAAIVSERSAKEKVLPLRKNLAPHNNVIREVMKRTTIIPMAFGHVARSDDDVLRALRRNEAHILAEVERLWAKVEMGLKVKWDVDNIFQHLIGLDPELSAFRDQLFGRSSPASQAEKIELGRMFEDRLAKEREREVERVTEAFRADVAEVRVNPPKGEKIVMDVAFLIDSEEAKSFEEKICKIAAAYPAQYIFDYSGPWAPFNFVELDFATKESEMS